MTSLSHCCPLGLAVIEDTGKGHHPPILSPPEVGTGELISNYGHDGVARGTQQQYDEAKWKEAGLGDIFAIHRPPFVIRWFMIMSN